MLKQAVLAEELGFEAYGVGDRHEAFGNQMLSISVDGLTESEQREQVERFATEVAPVLRREIPSTVWDEVKRAVQTGTVV